MNRNYFIFLIILSLITGIGTNLYCQDPVFSQFYAHPLELNPALAGNSGGTRIGLNYRNQWSNLSNNYTTYSISADHYLFGYNSGFGISLMADEAAQGIYRTISGGLAYSYEIETRNETKINLGIDAGFISVNLDFDKLIFYDQIDPVEGPISPGGIPYPTSEQVPDYDRITRFDFAAGMMMHNQNYFAGISLKHLVRPDMNFYSENNNTKQGLPIRLAIMGGYQIPVIPGGFRREPELAVTPHILFVKQGVMGQVNIGALFDLKTFNFGLSYRNGFKNPDAIIASIGINTGNLRIGYSYDATVSSLGFRAGGAHEIGISTVFFQDNGSKYSDCTKIFR